MARGQSILTDGLLVCEVMQFLHVCVCVCVACSVNHGDYIRAVFDRNIAENISRVLYPVDNVRIFTVQHMSVSSVQIQLDRFSRLDEHSSPTCNRQTDRQTDQSCPWVYFV